jgi:hypothetical protein
MLKTQENAIYRLKKLAAKKLFTSKIFEKWRVALPRLQNKNELRRKSEQMRR